MQRVGEQGIALAAAAADESARRTALRSLKKRALGLFGSILRRCTKQEWDGHENYLKAYHELIVESYQEGGLDSVGPVQPVRPHLRGRSGHPSNEEKKKLLELLGKSFEVACICEEELGSLRTKSEQEPGIDWALARVEAVCQGFHGFVQYLAHGTGQKRPLVANEYDVQRYLYGLLTVDFPDVRPEEPTASYGGSAARIDFLLMPYGIGIEAKMTREGLGDRQVVDQLLIDVAKYKRHRECRVLVCFVYDPAGRIRNRAQVTRDLESESNRRLRVRVFIRPAA